MQILQTMVVHYAEVPSRVVLKFVDMSLRSLLSRHREFGNSVDDQGPMRRMSGPQAPQPLCARV